MTNQELNNYLSNKQCCLESLTSETLDKLKIGSNDSRCKQKEVIFGNILFEVLSCTTINRSSFTGNLITPLSVLTPGDTVTAYINGIQISDTLSYFSSDFGEYFVDNVNLYNSTLDVYVDSNARLAFLNSNVVTGSYSVTVVTSNLTYPVINVAISNVTTYGNICLDEEDVCVITPYLNKICESC